MSNHVLFQKTKFVNLDEQGNEESESYGYMIADNYESYYCNLMQKDAVIALSAADALALIREHSDSLYDYVIERDSFYFGLDQVIVSEL